MLITGGAGFIGSHLVRAFLAAGESVVNLDALTYAGSRERLFAYDLQRPVHSEEPNGFGTGCKKYYFIEGEIGNAALVQNLLAEYAPSAIIHVAAESHVDRSIDSPSQFIETNIVGTHCLLEASLAHWKDLPEAEKSAFRFVYISTDEVFGSAKPEQVFDEQSPFRPSSPYAASKAAADLLVGSYHTTYGLPALTLHPSNTYGPWQLPEKFIPRFVCLAMDGKPLPLFGDGLYQRDWLHVDDCCAAIEAVLKKGKPGERYIAAGGNERTNLQIAQTLQAIVLNSSSKECKKKGCSQIVHVEDRPGHDRRYAISAKKIQQELGWQPKIDFSNGFEETILWYLKNKTWLEGLADSEQLLKRRGLL